MKQQLIHTTLSVDNRVLPKIVRWSWIILVLSSLLQFIFFPILANDLAIGCVLIAWLILTKFFLQSRTLNQYPLSSFIIIGFTSTQFYFPLIFTLLEGKPVVFNLKLPFEVFFHSIATLLILVLGHFLYQHITKNFQLRKSLIFSKAGFFVTPNDLQLWLMGIIGIFSAFYVHLYAGTASKTTGAVSDKFLEALVPFSYAPFFIPFSRLYGGRENPNKKLIPLLLLYTVVLFVFSIARNSRGAFMIGFTSVGFTYALGLLLGYYKPRFFTIRNLCIAIIGFWFFTGPLADIGTAMVMVRQQRSNIPYSKLLNLTLDAFNDKDAIRIYRQEGIIEEKTDWDEEYLNNIFLARFSNLKFNDTSLLLASKISEHDSDMRYFTINHFLSTLPMPVLNMLGINLNKESFNHVSFGDYLFAKVSGNPQVLGSFLTGHFAGTGMAAFGWWYLVILGIGMIPIYLLFDKLTIQERVPAALPNSRFHLNLRFSFCGLLALTSIFLFLPVESVESIASFLLRGWLQMVFLYFLMFHFTRRLSTWIGLISPSMFIKR